MNAGSVVEFIVLQLQVGSVPGEAFSGCLLWILASHSSDVISALSCGLGGHALFFFLGLLLLHSRLVCLIARSPVVLWKLHAYA